MKKLIVPAFALMVLAQWMVPVKMILDSESVLDEGTVYHFKTQPIDPSDPFRGKYVTLRFDVSRVETDTLYRYESGETVYALLSVDSAGFVKIENISPQQPAQLNNTLLQTTVRYASSYNGRQNVQLQFSFERFYVEESKAVATEQVYWNAQGDSTQVAYAVVKVRNGQGIIENVMINDRPILEIVREMKTTETLK